MAAHRCVPMYLCLAIGLTLCEAVRHKTSTVQGVAGIRAQSFDGSLSSDVGCSQDHRVAAISGSAAVPFAHRAGYVEVLEEEATAGGQLVFMLECSEPAAVSLQAEVITPDGNSDSLRVRVGAATREDWHLGGKTTEWRWSATSPAFPVVAGRHEVALSYREPGVLIRYLQLVGAQGTCRFEEESLEGTGDAAGERFKVLLVKHLQKPSPPLGQCWGDVAFAFAALHQDEDRDRANQLLTDVPSKYSLSSYDPYSEGDCYWALALIARVALHSRTRSKLECSAMSAIHEVMRQYVQDLSKFNNAANSSQLATWYITGSENHDAMKKGNILLFLQSLDAAGRGDETLRDGKKISEHLAAWEGYFAEYFRSRAQEGLLVECASPVYAKYSMQMFYNIRDLSRSRALRNLADQFLTLYWADHAHDFMREAGARAGASVRHYKLYQSQLDLDSLMPVTWAYGWHTNKVGLHPATLSLASSSYRPPDVVRDIALRDAPPHLYTSRRPGRGQRAVEQPLGIMYYNSFPANILRVTWWTNQFVQGTMTYDRDTTYSGIATQNRQMGVYFSDTSDRVAVLGIGMVQDHNRTGYEEITGVTGPGCSVIARASKAQDSSGTSIFISARLWDGRTEDALGWVFVRSGSGYAAVRPSTPGWSLRDSIDKRGNPDGVGKFMDLHDAWAPVVIQTGLASDFAAFGEFRDRVRAADFHLTDKGKLIYTSLARNVFRVWSREQHPPTIDQVEPELNPAAAFSSPYMQSEGTHIHLSSPVTEASLELDFA